MICNERQLRITTKELNKLNEALLELAVKKDDSWVTKAQYASLSSQLVDLRTEINDYMLLKQGKTRHFECGDLSNLPKILIKARIANGWTQKELAERLHMSEQQVQRYESSMYMGASLSKLIEIAKELSISVQESWSGSHEKSGDSIYTWNTKEDIDWSKFPAKEMLKRGWMNIVHSSSIIDSIKEFFEFSEEGFATAFHRKKFHGKNSPNEYSLLAWQAQVYKKAREIHATKLVKEFNYSENWLTELIDLSNEELCIDLVRDKLLDNGVILVFEEHLKGTYLDGAAMLLDTGNPVVALTLRHDRLDNFWFTLLHELGHVFLHLFDNLEMDFFDEEDGSVSDEFEREADEFALNYLIPKDKWDMCLSRFSMTESAVINDAENLGIGTSILAGRLRKESGNYRILNNLVGQGMVRKQVNQG